LRGYEAAHAHGAAGLFIRKQPAGRPYAINRALSYWHVDVSATNGISWNISVSYQKFAFSRKRKFDGGFRLTAQRQICCVKPNDISINNCNRRICVSHKARAKAPSRLIALFAGGICHSHVSRASGYSGGSGEILLERGSSGRTANKLLHGLRNALSEISFPSRLSFNIGIQKSQNAFGARCDRSCA
jgi:hypothetical protein